jgi:hypothetical protein
MDGEITQLLRLNNNFLYKILECLEEIKNKLEVIKNKMEVKKL